MRKLLWIVVALVSLVLVADARAQWVPTTLTEVFGFITGAVCVLLVVEQNIWNFPIGIANNVFFIILFFRARLFGDMGLQFVYVGLALHGWYWWLYGGEKRTHLRVTRTPAWEAVLLAGIAAAGTFGMHAYLVSVKDAAPLLDALTTVLSLIAQYLLNRKRLENWFVWIAADVIYVWLYVHRHLYLTAILYAVFIGMCVAGVLAWRGAMRGRETGDGGPVGPREVEMEVVE